MLSVRPPSSAFAKTIAGSSLFLLAIISPCAGAAETSAVAQMVAATCAGCHGQDGNGSNPRFPRLAGQQETYLLREMHDYRAGRRQSEIMVPLLSKLAEPDLVNLARYFATQSPALPVGGKSDLLALGKRVYLEGNTQTGVPSCDGCHEENGEGSRKFPRLAGQHTPYVLEQIAQYASGKRTNGVKVMRTIAERLTRAEAEAVAEYVANMK